MTCSSDWLPSLVLLEESGGHWQSYCDQLYRYFCNDFVLSSPRFQNIRVGTKRHPLLDGKEATFWHIISEGSVETERLPNIRRCERIRWPKPIIEAADIDRVISWTALRENKRGDLEERIHIAVADFSYLVVLAKRNGYLILWTAFPVEREHQRRKLQKEYAAVHRG